MTRLDFADYLAAIRRESAAFRDALAGCDPAARVPACPDWEAADLLWHLSEVQWFWGSVITDRPGGPPESHPDRPDSYTGLLETYDAWSTRLTDALEAAGPAEPAWSWAPEQTVGFTYRRQAHEALIHRIDAEQTAGLDPSPLDARLAADGVAELLEVMYGGQPPWGTFAPLPHLVLVELTDTDTQLYVQLGLFSGTEPKNAAGEGRSFTDQLDLTVVPAPPAGEEPDAVVQGPAGAVDTWLWQRGDDAEVHVTGDRSAYDRLREILSQPLD